MQSMVGCIFIHVHSVFSSELGSPLSLDWNQRRVWFHFVVKQTPVYQSKWTWIHHSSSIKNHRVSMIIWHSFGHTCCKKADIVSYNSMHVIMAVVHIMVSVTLLQVFMLDSLFYGDVSNYAPISHLIQSGVRTTYWWRQGRNVSSILR